jgi:glutathione S-transferase
VSLTLYDSRRAPNPRRVRWVMAEKRIEDIQVVEVDIFGGAHKTPEYVSRAGLPVVPVLDLGDGTAITESVAIGRYLESVYSEPNLFGRTPREIAEIEMWMRRAEMMLAGPLMMAVRHSHPALGKIETQVPEIAARNREGAEKTLGFFDRRLGEAEWLAGDRITIADIIAFTGLDFSRMVKFQVPGEMANVTRWAEAMRARPAAAAGV